MSNHFSPLAIPLRTLRADTPAVSAIGLGCMGMCDFYGPSDEAASLATIHAALDAGDFTGWAERRPIYPLRIWPRLIWSLREELLPANAIETEPPLSSLTTGN